MNIESISPSIRFANVFSYYTNDDVFVAGFDYRLFFLIDGSVFLKFKDFQIEFGKNTAVIIPPGAFYKFVPIEDKPIEILCINFDSIKGEGRPENSMHPVSELSFDKSLIFEKELIEDLGTPIILNDSGILKERLYEIIKEFTTRDIGYKIKCQCLLSSVLVSMIRSNKRSSKKDVRLISDVKDYLNDNLSSQIDSASIGERFHYHPNYINRIFKENLGITLHSYIISIRLDHAKQLLASSNLSLEKISIRCGFKTLSHFSQCFKKNCGISPKDYRTSSSKIVL